jgi:hypothetical protein
MLFIKKMSHFVRRYQLRQHIQKKYILIFLHIPKAAGSTFSGIIQQQYDHSSFLKMDFGIQQIELFKDFDEAEKLKIKAISGHMHFGLHELLPNPCLYVTMLRDPVRRLISHYYYICCTPNHRYHNVVVSKKISLEDFIFSRVDGIAIDNCQTRLLSGLEGQLSETSFGHCSDDMLNKAQKNLKDSFSVIGIAEKFQESYRLMQETLGWKPIPYSNKNVNSNYAIADILPQTLTLIEKYNELDIKLYRYALQIFEEKYLSIQNNIAESMIR